MTHSSNWILIDTDENPWKGILIYTQTRLAQQIDFGLMMAPSVNMISMLEISE
jgi:hypothetical protein